MQEQLEWMELVVAVAEATGVVAEVQRAETVFAG
jgi:hypothetical protein